MTNDFELSVCVYTCTHTVLRVLYILVTSPLLHVFYKYVSQSVSYFITVFQRAKVLNFGEIQFITFFFYGSCSFCPAQQIITREGSSQGTCIED